MMTAIHGFRPNCSPALPSPVSRRSIHQSRQLGFPLVKDYSGKSLRKSRSFHSIFSTNGQVGRTETINPSIPSPSESAWEDYPYEELPNGKRLYLDELDVLTFLNPPKELIPLDISSFNSATYLWKKIDDIPIERRHRLLHMITPSLISIAWEIAGTRYDQVINPKLVKENAPDLVHEYWNCRKSGGGVIPDSFKKVTFGSSSDDGMRYGRLIGTCFVGKFVSSMYPLYFRVSEVSEVISTGQPCDLAYEFGNGVWNVPMDWPRGFPAPAKHPWPFNDHVVIYIRHLGPGVMVGQAWQEGELLEQVPEKLCGEILMVKDYQLKEFN
ncbi:uncharacterized protein LOC124918891 [Impatiens glandulifera]|uniref:uncharacterized protein LOC124918891 n=1 Tax=Impatiens glandulifera TaxID=253017 RepID=UPI001FB0C13C|nr:uncharacterized protein LOC124918891 [Impatiens glandulifera]